MNNRYIAVVAALMLLTACSTETTDPEAEATAEPEEVTESEPEPEPEPAPEPDPVQTIGGEEVPPGTGWDRDWVCEDYVESVVNAALQEYSDERVRENLGQVIEDASDMEAAPENVSLHGALEDLAEAWDDDDIDRVIDHSNRLTNICSVVILDD